MHSVFQNNYDYAVTLILGVVQLKRGLLVIDHQQKKFSL